MTAPTQAPSKELVFTLHHNRADDIYEFAPTEWAKVKAHIAKLEKEHIEDIDRMERAAIVVEDLTRQLNERHAHEPQPATFERALDEFEAGTGPLSPAHEPRAVSIIAICVAYESGFGHGAVADNLANPYAENTIEHEAYHYGYESGITSTKRAASAQPPEDVPRSLIEEALLTLDSAGDALGRFNQFQADKCWPMAAKLRAALTKEVL